MKHSCCLSVAGIFFLLIYVGFLHFFLVSLDKFKPAKLFLATVIIKILLSLWMRFILRVYRDILER